MTRGRFSEVLNVSFHGEPRIRRQQTVEIGYQVAVEDLPLRTVKNLSSFLWWLLPGRSAGTLISGMTGTNVLREIVCGNNSAQSESRFPSQRSSFSYRFRIHFTVFSKSVHTLIATSWRKDK